MGKRNKQRRKEQAKGGATPPAVPDRPPRMTRRVMIIASIIAILICTPYLYQVCNAIWPGDVAKASLESARAHGDIVFDEGGPKATQLFLCIKQMHGGPSTVPSLLRDPARLRAFADHQETIRQLLESQLSAIPRDRMRFFLEGFADGQEKEWETALDAVLKTDGMLRDPAQRLRMLGILEGMMRSPNASSRAGAVAMLGGAGRFAARCRKDGPEVIHGADPADHPPLTSVFHGLLERLSRKDSPTDADIADTARRIREATEEDERVRHAYIADQLRKHVPGGGVGILVLGANHFATGANYPGEKTTQPLERILAAIPETRTVVLDPAGLATMVEVPEGTKLIGSKPTVEELRLYLETRRKK